MAEYILKVDEKEHGLQKKMIRLLSDAGIRPDPHLDYNCVLVDEDDNVLASGSLFRNTLRCLAVRPDLQGEGYMGRIVSHLLQIEISRGYTNAFLCTKPSYKDLMTDLGFHEIVSVPGAVFMESRKDGFVKWLEGVRIELKGEEWEARSKREEYTGTAAIVMNANPFTLGHRHLAETAAKAYTRVVVFVVEEENGAIPFSVRYRLVREGLRDLPNVTVLPSGPYVISQATFPSYFLKDEEEAVKTHTSVDLAVFTRIAYDLGITARLVGEEPESPVTRLYNDAMQKMLPEAGIGITVIPRIKAGRRLISASTVRKALVSGNFETVREMTPESTWRFFASEEAEPVLRALFRGSVI
ncbi:MAG: [Lachnospiraceae bacterium]|nr:[citrate (pro-3S)-lyase] ligase [Lachnospiraceae bacterium]